ncbi:MAG: hypothetical protein EZS26_001771 [Candidatus Ordinivivax streblomastigis]|uniref:MPN domain-containing protein n=1 Tax=Candidatus Ordinivivax streblomastigis TaxID=2540710 RepID=A0A5M8P1G8_9BACT|nr:MAG: hypothetical protein EZS26_001771 [Candidatus Ordinivivax streblomastigis]
MTETIKLSVKDWSPDDQPREKLLLKGVQALSNTELLAIIIGSGSRDENVIELSQRILQSAGNQINQLGKWSIEQLMQFKGIGEAKAISVMSALELGKRRKAEEVWHREQIRCSRDIYFCFYPILCDLPHEEFWILLLNRANKIIDKVKISQGGVSTTVVDARMVYKEALQRLTTSVILCHNHPSGRAQPSTDDDRITMRISTGLRCLDMSLQDHLILCDGSYYSYSDEGRLLNEN